MNSLFQSISKNFASIFNGLLWVAILYLLVQRAIVWQKESELRGQTVSIQSIAVLQPDQQWRDTEVLHEGKKKVLVFWATWCGPCSVELARIQKMFESGGLSHDQFLAVSVMENPEVVSQAARERGYLFPVAADPSGQFTEAFKISGTPTTALMDGANIVNISTGLSFFTEKNIRDFLSGSH